MAEKEERENFKNNLKKLFRIRREKEIEKPIENWFKKLFRKTKKEIVEKEYYEKPIVKKGPGLFARLLKAVKPRKITEKKISEKIIEKPAVREVVIAERKHWFEDFMRRIRERRKQGYYGTVRVEKEIRKAKIELEKGEKIALKELKKTLRKQKKIQRAREKEIKKAKRRAKKINLMRKLGLIRKQGYYGTAELEKEIKKTNLSVEKESSHSIKEVKKRLKKQARENYKQEKQERKKRIKILKKEIKKRKMLNTLNELKSEGYYGTSELEEEIRHLKRKKKRKI
jgi:hypothetical protein